MTNKIEIPTNLPKEAVDRIQAIIKEHETPKTPENGYWEPKDILPGTVIFTGHERLMLIKVSGDQYFKVGISNHPTLAFSDSAQDSHTLAREFTSLRRKRIGVLDNWDQINLTPKPKEDPRGEKYYYRFNATTKREVRFLKEENGTWRAYDEHGALRCSSLSKETLIKSGKYIKAED